MRIINLKDLSKKEYQTIISRSFASRKDITSKVKIIMEKVKKEKDRAIFSKYQKRYGKKNYQSIQVFKKEIREAYKEVDKKLISALKQMIKNITAVHNPQLPRKKDTIVYPEKGISIWREWRPIEKVGLYIPGGKAVYPSSVLMSGIPAKIAGCKEIIICSPPREKGQIPYSTLVAADLIGVEKIYKVGGAEAIAAMIYGTETVPKVYKVFGAGNSYVTKAKVIAFSEIAIDLPAGPSEVFVIADETANPSFIAADLLADGEHGGDSACVLVTDSRKLAQETIKEIKKQLPKLKTCDWIKKSLAQYGLIAIVDDLKDAISFANKYAPEHLTIMTKKQSNLVKEIKNAGSVFLGRWTSKSAGDYATGANHILPTGGAAKMYSPLGVEAFGKWMQVQKCTKRGLLNIKNTIETMAEVEQLPAHRVSTSIRFKNCPKTTSGKSIRPPPR